VPVSEGGESGELEDWEWRIGNGKSREEEGEAGKRREEEGMA